MRREEVFHGNHLVVILDFLTMREDTMPNFVVIVVLWKRLERSFFDAVDVKLQCIVARTVRSKLGRVGIKESVAVVVEILIQSTINNTE